MTKIEEIKERVGKIKNAPWKRSEEYSHDYYLQGYSVDAEKGVPNIADCIEEVEDADLIANAPTDIQYLLSKLEIAEKALNKVIYSKLANPNVTADDVIKIADEGLAEFYKAIREGE